MQKVYVPGGAQLRRQASASSIRSTSASTLVVTAKARRMNMPLEYVFTG